MSLRVSGRLGRRWVQERVVLMLLVGVRHVDRDRALLLLSESQPPFASVLVGEHLDRGGPGERGLDERGNTVGAQRAQGGAHQREPTPRTGRSMWDRTPRSGRVARQITRVR